MKFVSAEIWSDLACNSGTRLAAIADAYTIKEVRATDGADSLVVIMPRSSSSWSQVQEGRVIRILGIDPADTLTFDEWRIIKTSQSHKNEGYLGSFTCASIVSDLGRGLMKRTEIDGLVVHDFELLGLTPTALVDVILADCPTYFSKGTVTPTAALDLQFAWDSPLAALRSLADKCNTEISVRRNGTTGYYIDLTTIGSAATTIYFLYGKNLAGVNRQTDTEKLATRIFVKTGGETGAPMTIARAKWKISAISTNTYVDLVDPAGGKGPAVVADQLNNRAIRRVGGTFEAITDTVVQSATTTRCYVASTTGMTVNDLVEIRQSTGGNDLTWLDHPAAQATYGVIPRVLERTDLPPHRNLVSNSQLTGSFSGSPAVPSGYAAVGSPTITAETNPIYTRRGGQSAKIVATADGQGIETTLIGISPTTVLRYLSWFVTFMITSGQVRVELYDGSNSALYPDGNTNKAWSNQLNQWVDLGMAAGIDAYTVSSTSVKIRIVADGGAATFYVDSFQLIQSAAQEVFFAGDGPLVAWQAGNEELLTYAYPLVTLEIDIVDLTRMDSSVWPYDDVVLGGTCVTRHPDMGLDITTRVVKVERDVMNAYDTKVTLSNRPEDLSDIVYRPKSRARINNAPNSTLEPIVTAKLERDVTNITKLYVTLTPRPAGASVFYLVQDVGDPVPVLGLTSGTTNWCSYGSTFQVDVGASALQLSAYCQIGTYFSQVVTWILDKKSNPTITLSIVENPGGTAIFGWTPNQDVSSIYLYRKKHAGGVAAGQGEGWPVIATGTSIAVTSVTRSGSTVTVQTTSAHGLATDQIVVIAGATPNNYNGSWVITVTDSTHFTFPITGTPTTPATGTITARRGAVDSNQFIGSIGIAEDAGAYDSAGSPLAGMAGGTGVGGTSWTDSLSYANTDVIKALAIPVDRNNNVGVRVRQSKIMAGAPSPRLTSFSVSRTGDGSSCSDQAVVSCAYGVADCTAGGQDLVIEEWINGDLYDSHTIADPTSGSPYSDTSTLFWASYRLGSTDLTIEYKAILKDQATGTVLDAMTSLGASCKGFICA